MLKVIASAILVCVIGILSTYVFSELYIFFNLSFFILIILILFYKSIKKWVSDIDEKTSLALIIILPIISSSFFLIPHGTEAYVSSYNLHLTPVSDSLVVEETLIYHMTGKEHAHEFYRNYKPIGPMSNMKIIEVSCPSEFSSRVKNYPKEVSCIKPYFISAGDYVMKIKYEIPKPYVCYDDYCYIQWKVFDDFKIDVKGINVVAENADDFFTFPSLYENAVKKGGMLEVNLVVSRDKVSEDGIYIHRPGKYPSDFKSSYLIPNLLHSTYFLVLLFILFTLILLIIYSIFGKEYEFPDVPSVLHYLPTKRKPYLVNYIFYGDPYKMEDEGTVSTILDLARKGVWKIDRDKLIFTGKLPKLDSYERKVYESMKKLKKLFGEGNTLSFKKVKEKVKRTRDITLLKKVKDVLKDIEKAGAPKAYDNTGGILVKVMFSVIIGLGLGVLIFFPVLTDACKVLISYGATGLLSVFVFDFYTFGRYKKEYAKERAMWSSFRNLLKNYSLIKKYSPQDLNSWGEWLVYATALGSAKNVLKAMKEFKIEVPNIDSPDLDYISPYNISGTASSRYSSLTHSGGGGWSGGGGFGGGFGGGGGGFR